jgi:shikimate kinase
MKLIFIYGPPAVGKYTVGTALATQTGYKLFHNHLTVDVVRALFDDDDVRRSSLLCDLRLQVIIAAADANIDIIFTLAHTAGESDVFVVQVIDAVTARGGSVHFVRLQAPDETLYARLGNESRHLLRKPTDPERLRRKLLTPIKDKIDYRASIDLNTSRLTPQESAQCIIDAFHL